MTLTPGTRLGAYDITAKLGEGGMGEVYRATDTKLKRQVAIKILPASVAADTDRLARFRREAEVLASLNHPNIAGIYGFEDSGSTHALVMELVEGEDLAQRIARGPIPLDEALTIARQIADALEAAHEQGIIHRDLKPANVKVRDDGTVKVLDFGLAKAMEPASAPVGGSAGQAPSMSPTITTPAMTAAGMILGTAAYMSPEQAKGRAVDKRSDVWAFGCVLFEMLSGKRAFDGEDVSDTLAVVLRGEPEWAALPAGLPASIAALIKRCLEKDRKARIGDIAVVKYVLADPSAAARGAASTTGAAAPPRSRWLSAVPWAIAAAATASAVIVVAMWAPWKTTPAPQPVRFTVTPGGTLPLALGSAHRDLALSPDGSHLAYIVGTNPQNSELWVRNADRLDAVQLRGVTAPLSPAFSPDGQWIVFVSGSELKKVSVTGGPPITLATLGATASLRGVSWGDGGQIVFGTNDRSNSGLLSVPAGGGEPKALTEASREHGFASHQFPFVLPGGHAVLFTIVRAAGVVPDVAVLDLATGRTKVLVRGGGQAEYVPSGHLVYDADGSLRAVRFDPVKLEVLSDPVPVLENVFTKSTGAAEFSVSRTGVVAYASGSSAGGAAARTLVWVDRHGHEEPINAPIRAYQRASVSPDGTRLALDIRDQQNDIWTWDLAHQTLTRLTSDPGTDSYPVWTADSLRIIFASSRGGNSPSLYWQAADGSGAAEELTKADVALGPLSMTPGGTGLLFRKSMQSADLMLLHFDARRTVEPVLQSSFEENNGVVSPDGHWLAYDSNDSGRVEVYVRPYPNVNDGHRQISTQGGRAPLWAPNGRELFFVDGESKLTVVPVTPSTGGTFNFGSATRLLDTAYFTPTPTRAYDIAPDGQKFIFAKNVQTSQGAAPGQIDITVALNWQEELKQRLPTLTK